MKLIVAGSRYLHGTWIYDHIFKIIDKNDLEVTEIVSGGAYGPDKVGESYAKFYGIPITLFEPDWDRYGLKAGPIRNAKMAIYGDALLLIWDGISKGSASMKKAMKALNKPIYEIVVEE